ncbi:MAG: arginine--tRNA ligase [bacterium]
MAMNRILEEQKVDLADFGVHYDSWFKESDLHREGMLEKALFFLEQRGLIFSKEGAIWFKSSQFMDKQDRVLKKRGETPTYFLSDIAYHKNKFDRGFDILINIWGADHHGYVDRIRSSVQALGYNAEALEILIVQLVRFKQSGELVRMSKRAGNIITLSDLIEEVGKDVARFFFLMRARESHLDFDLELARDKSESNPLYYLQYAHARICSITAKAAESGLKWDVDKASTELLKEPRELYLMKLVDDFPWEVESSAEAREPHRMIKYLTELATEFHTFYHEIRVLTDDVETSQARLVLCEAVRNVMRNGLKLLGLSAPEEMR